MKKLLCLLFVILFSFSGTGQESKKINYGNNPEAGDFVSVNGVNLYYETYGSGKPLLLLHGNGGSIKGHTEKINFFKDHFKVVVVDSRAHGKSQNTSRDSLTYLKMAEDIRVLMDSLKIEDAYLWGQSDGGIIGLLLAIHHPEKISKLAVFGANLFPGEEAVHPELHHMLLETLSTTEDPRTKKLFSLMAYQPDISDAELGKITCPVLVMSGDRDAIKLDHTLRIFRNIEKSNLFIMPGATHFGSYEKPELFNTVLLNFFKKPFSKPSTIEKLLKT